MMKSEYRVGAYERLSKEDNRNDESSSIESQKMIIESFASFHQMKIIRHYCDDGYTGSNFNRPGFEDLINDIEKGYIDCVIVKDLSRLGRELYKTGTYIEDYFLARQVRFIAVNDGYDSNVGDAMLGIRLSVNDLYLRDTSKKIRSSLDAKRKKGDYIGSFAKYGYMKNPQNPKQLIPDPMVSSHIIQMFEWASVGLGTGKIAQKLTSCGYPIPSVYKNENRSHVLLKNENQGRGIWRAQTVKSILTDQIYLGHMVQGRWKKLSYHSKKLVELPEDQWIIVKNTHQPLISQELFDKVQIALKKTKKYSAKKDKKYLLQGLLFCKECGHAISISEKKYKTKTSHYGHCNYYQKYSKYKLCTAHHFNYDQLEQDMRDFFLKIGEKMTEDRTVDKLMASFFRFNDQNLKKNQDKIKELKKEYNKKNNLILKLYEDRLNDIISLQQYQLLASKYDNDIKILLKEIKGLKKAIVMKTNDCVQKKYQQRLREFLKSQYITHEFLYQVIDRIDISENKTVDIYFKVDFSNYLTE